MRAALPSLCLRSFWATEAALSLAAVTHNLTVLFQRHLGWQQKVTIQTLRYWLFVTSVVAAVMGEDSESDSQLPCSRKPAGIEQLK